MNQIRIVMTGLLNIPPYQQVTWSVYNQPDNTGAQSGYPLGSLINIQADYLVDPNQTINPISLVVGGDLSGSLPNPSVSGLQGKPIDPTAPTAGQILVFNGTKYVPTLQATFAYGRITNPGLGVPSIILGSNLASVTGGGALTPGAIRVTFTTPASSDNYTVLATCYPTNLSTTPYNFAYVDLISTVGFSVFTFSVSDNGLENDIDVGISVFGG